VESRNDGLYWITLKVDKDSGEIINNETWLCSPLKLVGSGSDGQSVISFCAVVRRVATNILPGRYPVLILESVMDGAHLKLVE